MEGHAVNALSPAKRSEFFRVTLSKHEAFVRAISNILTNF